MENQIEHEMCNNCKKEIPQFNYVMHTAHCARNITLCSICKEPVPKNQFEDHKSKCKPRPTIKPQVPLSNLEKSSYFQNRKEVEDKKAALRKESYMSRHKFLDNGYSLRESSVEGHIKTNGYIANTPQSTSSSRPKQDSKTSSSTNTPPMKPKIQQPLKEMTFAESAMPKSQNSLLPCKFCDLELPKLDLEDHENYCGSRTDKCLECGEHVMFKYKQIHMDSNHGFLKLEDEPGPRPSWDSSTQRSSSTPSANESSRRRPPPFRPFSGFDSTLYSFPTTYSPSYTPYSSGSSPANGNKEKSESYKDLSRRLDCKTEYIRNLLHDSASITVPLRHNGAVPRNHFNHNKGPAPQPPRKRNPPTELVIPCEFCDTPIPHDDLIRHETGCRPDLARLRRRSPSPDDYFIAPQPSSPEVELPCEFCADMIPASQLLRHQATCT